MRACVPRCRLLCNIAAAAAAWLPTTVSVIDNKTDAAAEQWTLYQQASHMARRALNRQFMVCDVVYLRWTSSISGLLTDRWRRLQTRLINISSVLHHGGPPSCGVSYTWTASTTSSRDNGVEMSGNVFFSPIPPIPNGSFPFPFPIPSLA